MEAGAQLQASLQSFSETAISAPSAAWVTDVGSLSRGCEELGASLGAGLEGVCSMVDGFFSEELVKDMPTG